MPGRLAALLPAALLLFFAAAFVLPNQSAYALVFYIAGLPTIAASLVQSRPPPSPPLGIALALIAFSAATLLWGTDDGHRSARFAWDSFNTAAFLLGLALALPNPALRRRLANLLCGLGAANAGFAIALSLFLKGNGPRLHGWGATLHPILGADVMAVAYLTALWGALAGHPWRGLRFVAAALMAAFILLTESRGPLLAAAAATLLLCLAGPWRGRALQGLAACAAIWWALPKSLQHHAAGVIVQRGSSHRFEIWHYAIGVIRERPILGHGLAANLHLNLPDPQGHRIVTEHITFAHDLYFSLLFYSGLVGLLLFVALAAVLAGNLLRHRTNPETPWLAALGLNLLVAGLTDFGQITKGPGPLWFVLWLPVGLMLTYPTRSRPAPS